MPDLQRAHCNTNREYYRQRQNKENERRQQREAVPHTLQDTDAVLSLSVDSYEPNYDNSPETSPNTIANRGAVSHNDLEEEFVLPEMEHSNHTHSYSFTETNSQANPNYLTIVNVG